MLLLAKIAILIFLFPYSLLLIPYIFRKAGCYIAAFVVLLPLMYAAWGIYTFFGEQYVQANAMEECEDQILRGMHPNPEQCAELRKRYTGLGLITMIGEALPTPVLFEWLNQR